MSMCIFFCSGTDEQAIINLLGSRSNKQRVALPRAYKTSYGKVTVLEDRVEISYSKCNKGIKEGNRCSLSVAPELHADIFSLEQLRVVLIIPAVPLLTGSA